MAARLAPLSAAEVAFAVAQTRRWAAGRKASETPQLVFYEIDLHECASTEAKEAALRGDWEALPPRRARVVAGEPAARRVLVGDVVVVMGGQAASDGPASDAVFTLDLSTLDSSTEDPIWRTRPAIPTGGRMLPVAATHQGEVFLFSGVALESDGDSGYDRVSPYLPEALAFDPRSESDSWRILADLPRPAAAAAGRGAVAPASAIRGPRGGGGRGSIPLLPPLEGRRWAALLLPVAT